MRMSNHVGMYTQQSELTFYDYLIADGYGTDYNTFLWIDTPVLSSDVKISTRIKPMSDRGTIYAIQKYGTSGTNYKRGLEIFKNFYSRLNFAASDGPYYGRTVGDYLNVGTWYDVTAEFNGQIVYITIGETTYEAEGFLQEFVDGGDSWKFFGNDEHRFTSGSAAIGITNFYDLNDNLLANLIPCVKRPGKYVGVYDTVNEAFYAAYLNGVVQTTNSTIISVGNLT